ncbi:hypothetical protein [Rhizobacter sp. SG703]|uniref:hypothetical protein n=1 Tax=Rhizobacter sp. SG703 TaxID=2587140 RepID=UPI001445350C|nr:hypothetical protein [Rhizobacter sp. SG703]NKI94705.1 hypothetical protein [Rhizobacter sp. SG703]
MKHHYSKAYLSDKLGSLSYQGARFVGAGVALFLGVLATLWISGPHEPKYVAVFLLYLLLAGGVGGLIVLVRRIFRKPEALRTTTFEIDRHGLWRQTESSRQLMIGSAELVSIEVFRSRVNELLRIELRSQSQALEVQGLEDMDQFSADLRQQFPRVPFNVHRPSDDLQIPEQPT